MTSKLTKEELRKVLGSHGVTLPPVSAKKEELVKLYQEVVGDKENCSSDDEIAFNHDASRVETNLDISNLDDDSLSQLLKDHGVDVGPIVASTRSFYEKKLAIVMSGSQFSSGAELSDTENEEDDDQPSAVTVEVGHQNTSPNKSSLRQRITQFKDEVDSVSPNKSIHNYKEIETKKEVVTRTRDGRETRDSQHTLEREETNDPPTAIKRKNFLLSKLVKLVLIILILVVIYLIVTTKTDDDDVAPPEKVIASVQSHQDLPDRDSLPDASNVADI